MARPREAKDEPVRYRPYKDFKMENEYCCPDNTSGCMVCGRELYCIPDTPLLAKCFYCGKEETTHVFCPEGHYACDECHSKDILRLVESECMKSDSSDPIELALDIFSLPKLHMHGPEYHSIVPAVLVAAYGNSVNSKDAAAVREAISRGRAVPGGICGTHGACGAGIGVGIAYSIIHKATPYSKEERGEANRMTALALTAISLFGGPRCCKRDSISAIETAKKYFQCFGTIGKKYICSQFTDNEKCIKTECPYYPANNKKQMDF